VPAWLHGILCLHGFTASPSEMSWLGQHLAGEGYTVYGLRTPGHGTDPHDLDRYLWQDWFAAVLDGYHLLRAQCDRVVVVGHSMGGLLGLLLACAEPVNGLVVLASPLLYADKRLAYANWMAKVMPYTIRLICRSASGQPRPSVVNQCAVGCVMRPGRRKLLVNSTA